MRQFIAYFHFVSWGHISFGFHVCLHSPNVELHIPFGFFRIGWVNGRCFAENAKSYGLMEDRVALDNKMSAGPVLVRLRWRE